VGGNWQDKTPLRMNIAYFVVDTAENEIRELWPGKKIQAGYLAVWQSSTQQN
jgi:hypothetical protein